MNIFAASNIDYTNMINNDLIKCKNESIPYQINQLKLMMQRSFNRILKKSSIDLTSEQMHLLTLLLGKNEINMNEISNELMVDNSAITRLVDNLEKKKYVSRKVSKEDRRLRLISITETGRNEICRAKHLATEHQNTLLKDIDTKEIKHFMGILNKMKANVELSFYEDNKGTSLDKTTLK